MENKIITKELLNTIGASISDDKIESYVDKLNEMLQERVGAEIIRSLDDEQFGELVEIQKTGDTEKVQDWIRANVPDFNDIVKDEVDIIIGQIAESVDEL